MIPRILHYIWVGSKPLPTELIDNWREMHPNWAHQVWREDDIRALGLRNADAFEAYLRMGVWHGAANVARVEIVERVGGVYVDADTVPLRPFDRGSFMRAGLFAGYVQPRPEYPGLIGNAYIGAVPGHPALRIASRLIAKRDDLMPPWIKTGVLVFTRAVQKAQANGIEDIHIAPPHVFFPHDKHGNPAPAGKGATYARHLWGSTKAVPWNYGDPIP